MKIMEKKKYNKPEVKSTKIDVCINLQPTSNDNVGEPTVPTDPPNETGVGGFMNPFKWFK